MNVKIKLLSKNALIPTKGSDYSAGVDLYAMLNDSHIDINPHATAFIHTGMSIELPHNTFGGIFSRSGLATKNNLKVATGVSVIDEDYRGEIMIPLYNDSDKVKTIVDHERIAQLVIIPYMPVEFNVVNELDKTERGDGGFGSTGK